MVLLACPQVIQDTFPGTPVTFGPALELLLLAFLPRDSAGMPTGLVVSPLTLGNSL
jgi:hypothetical protein